MAEPRMPDDLVRLWRLRTGPRLGRPAELDIDRVVGAAVRLADEGGLPAATLPKIAAALSVTPMSLYRHIGSKDELVGLMGDAALGAVPESDAGPWRPALRRWAMAQSEVFGRRPWLAQLPVTGPPRGPNAIAWMDAGLRALRDTDLDWAAKIGVITVVGGYVRQAFVMDRQLAESRSAVNLDEAQALRDYVRELTEVVDPALFPDVTALLGSGLFESIPEPPDSANQDFAFGLELILDGVAAAAGTTGSPGG
ncbi:MAG: TetR/AcrR family transcriptional regulator [Nocardia sp.]|uniref:TetR/AcrR family transcriptional regulator n=1 Tax=Nocardia sp. TaxID=1821 RepID=UPI002634B38D|nr:TetR/AcrR family transcriptional regulator [Nocardia sp.]MCU1641093.1 TetR/AcrR family transcriptional regulator [Nocardia sp.]